MHLMQLLYKTICGFKVWARTVGLHWSKNIYWGLLTVNAHIQFVDRALQTIPLAWWWSAGSGYTWLRSCEQWWFWQERLDYAGHTCRSVPGWSPLQALLHPEWSLQLWVGTQSAYYGKYCTNKHKWNMISTSKNIKHTISCIKLVII